MHEVAAFTWRELIAICGTADLARAGVQDGIYRRVLRGAYVLGDVPDDTNARCAALRLVLPDGMVLSHWAALWALGLGVLPRDGARTDILDVTVRRGLHLQARPGLRPHSALLPDEELCSVGGLIVSAAARACVDVARSFGLVEGVACSDAALRAGVATEDQIASAVERAAGLRGVLRARAMLPHLEPRSESLMESRVRIGFVVAGGPRMLAQVDLYNADGEHCGRADLYLDGVVVEYDGREERLKREKFAGDRRRQADINDLSVEVRRFTADDYYKTSAAARLAVLRRALTLAAGRSRPHLRFGPDTLRPPRLTPLPTLAEQKARKAA